MENLTNFSIKGTGYLDPLISRLENKPLYNLIIDLTVDNDSSLFVTIKKA